MLTTPPDSKAIPGYDGFYRIDIHGCVWSSRAPGGRCAKDKRGPWKKMRPAEDLDGYFFINLTKDGRLINHKIHRLVLEAFIGPCPPRHESRHLNSKPGDCRLGNLEWATKRVNALDKVRRGSHRGEKNGMAKMTWSKVRKIRQLYRTGRFTQAELNDRYGISSVDGIVNHAYWKE